MNDQPITSEDRFENGYFWELYKDLERQFQSFLTYVPYLEGNEKTYSFRLLNLILSIGGHVDSAFKEMARYSGFAKNEHCIQIMRLIKSGKTIPIPLPLKAFDKEYRVCNEKVIFKKLHEGELLQPFRPRDSKSLSPEWWKVYNSVKHDVGVNLKSANLRNTLYALAGAFLLNVRHIPGALRLYDKGLLRVAWSEKLRGKPACEEVLRDQVEEMLGENSPLFVETPLFLYLYGRG